MNIKILLLLYFLFSAVNIFAQTAEEFNNIGLAKYYAGDYDGAIIDFANAINLDPNNINAFKYRRLAKMMKGDFDGAISDYEKIMDLDPKEKEEFEAMKKASEELAESFWATYVFASQNYENAIEGFTENILKRRSAIDFEMRGRCYLRLDDFERAVQDFETALQIDTNFHNLAPLIDALKGYLVTSSRPAFLNYYIKSMELCDYGDYQEADSLCRIAVQMNPASFDSHFLLGQILYAKQEYNEAAEEFIQAFNIDLNKGSSSTKVILWIGESFYAQKNYRQAIQWYEKALISEPTNKEVLANLGWNYYEIKEYEVSISYWQKVLSIDSCFHFFRFNLALALLCNNNIQDALNEYEMALKNCSGLTTIQSYYQDLEEAKRQNPNLEGYDNAIALFKNSILFNR